MHDLQADKGPEAASNENSCSARPPDDFAEALDFAEGIAQGGRLSFASIPHDDRPPSGPVIDFGAPGARDRARAWLQANASGNLYYSLNEPRPSFTGGKMKRGDVATIRGIVVDLDPNPAVEAEPGGYARERKRLLGKAATQRMLGDVSTVVDTGNGVQLLWIFPEPLEAGAEIVAAVEAQARALARLHDGDATHSVDHLFRLPGCRNIPNAKKREKGRVETRSRMLGGAADRFTLQDLARFAPPLACISVPAAHSLPELDYPEILDAAHGGVEALPWHLADVARKIHIPEDIEDRSGRDFSAAVRAVQLGIIDPTELGRLVFALSPEKLIEKDETGKGEDYAARTVIKALAAAQLPLPETIFGPASLHEGTPAPPAAGQDTARARRDYSGGIQVVQGPIDARKLPRRGWVVEPRYPLGDVSLLVGSPGASKSAFALRDAVAVAWNRGDILEGRTADGRPITPERLKMGGPVIVYNAEERLVEQQRRLNTLFRFHGIQPDSPHHPIVLWSGIDGATLTIMDRSERGRPLRCAEGAAALKSLILEHEPVLVILDTLLSLSRGASENDSADQDAIMQELAQLAAQHRLSLGAVHHTSKQGSDASGDQNASRGSSAIIGKVRAAATLLPVSEARASKLGIPWRPRMVQLEYTKSSHAVLPSEPILFTVRSELVGNGDVDVNKLGKAGEAFDADLLGDTVPVHEVLDAAALKLDLKSGAARPENAEKIAEIFDQLLDDHDEMLLTDLRDAAGVLMVGVGITTARSRQKIVAHIQAALVGSGVSIRNGVRIRLTKSGQQNNSPWRVQRLREGEA